MGDSGKGKGRGKKGKGNDDFAKDVNGTMVTGGDKVTVSPSFSKRGITEAYVLHVHSDSGVLWIRDPSKVGQAAYHCLKAVDCQKLDERSFYVKREEQMKALMPKTKEEQLQRIGDITKMDSTL